jgi:hypothetical protein
MLKKIDSIRSIAQYNNIIYHYYKTNPVYDLIEGSSHELGGSTYINPNQYCFKIFLKLN